MILNINYEGYWSIYAILLIGKVKKYWKNFLKFVQIIY